MKRSERIYQQAFHSILWASLLLVSGIALGVWAVVAFLSGNPMLSVVSVAAAAAAFYASLLKFEDAMRSTKLAEIESLYELRSSIRPRIESPTNHTKTCKISTP